MAFSSASASAAEPSAAKSFLSAARFRQQVYPKKADIAAACGGEWPGAWPFSAADFQRYDPSPDTRFYAQPRFVHHIDDGARAAITSYYAAHIAKMSDVLDIASSWVSHLPEKDVLPLGRVAGVGMNDAELERNPALTEYVVEDLNANGGKLAMHDAASFDAALCVVSTDYMAHPKQLFSEVFRVLRPGGQVILSQSNRCFPTKTIGLWNECNDAGHAWILGCYLHFNGFVDVKAELLDTAGTDPLFVVTGKKAAAGGADELRAEL